MSQKSTKKETLSTTRRGFLRGISATVVIAALPSIPISRVGFNAPVDEYLIRSQIWSRQIKEMLLDELVSMKYKDIDI